MTNTQPLTKVSVSRIWAGQGFPRIHEVLEGEVTMTPQQQDQYKSIIGDGNAKVTVSRDVTEKEFGQGGHVFLSITLTCDQSVLGLSSAMELSKQLADYLIWQHHAEFKNQLVAKGILK